MTIPTWRRPKPTTGPRRLPASDLGMRPLVAHCHLGLGKLYRRMGDRQQAQEHLHHRHHDVPRMDMRFWLEQAEAHVMP